MVKQVYYAKWVREQQLNPSALATVHADSDKMAPRIQCGDQLLVDRSQTDIISGRIYVMWYNNRLWVKRFHEQDDGSLLIEADNSQTMPSVLQLPASLRAQAHILGRVVHVQGTAGL